jgi:parallel beta helix pectate lyase-like protein
MLAVFGLVVASSAPGTSSAPEMRPGRPPKACARFAAENGSDSNRGTWRAPFRTAQRLLNSLRTGQTGCLRAGTYTTSRRFVLDFSKSNVAVMGSPGERAVLQGIVVVRSGTDGVRLARVSVDGVGGANTIQVYGAGFVLEDSTITNGWRGRSCLILGDSSAGTAVRPLIRRNRFHECGSLAEGNQDHAIYASKVVDGRIIDNIVWNTAAYAIHLYPNAQRTLVYGNTIDGGPPSVRGGIIVGGDSDDASNDNLVEYNVVAYSATYNIDATWEGPVGTGNVARSNCLWGGAEGEIDPDGGLLSEGNVVGDPRFVDRAQHDLRVGARSVCRAVVSPRSTTRTSNRAGG